MRINRELNCCHKSLGSSTQHKKMRRALLVFVINIIGMNLADWKTQRLQKSVLSNLYKFKIGSEPRLKIISVNVAIEFRAQKTTLQKDKV